MISVVIPLYNKADTIERTLESVFAQTYKDYEIIIVDDGSTDGSAEIVERIADSRIRLIRQKNAGVSAARNRGVREAKGEYIAFLDADDEWMVDYLQSQIKMTLDYPNCDIFATDYLMKSTQGTQFTQINKLRFQEESGLLNNYFEVASYSSPPLWTSAIMATPKALTSIGGFPIGIKSGEDLLTWARLAARYKIAYSRKPLAIFNVEGYEVTEKPKRVPAEDDIVGRELLKIKSTFSPESIDKYISHWHKMRSSVYMRLNMRTKSIKEALKGLKYNPLNYKLLIFIAVNLLPRKFQPF